MKSSSPSSTRRRCPSSRKDQGTSMRDAATTREAPQLREDRAVVGLVPGLDRPFRQALVLVGHHEVEVHLDQVAEAVTGGAGPERVVEGEEARLRLHEGPAAARRTRSARRRAARRPARHHRDRATAPLRERDLERVDEAPALSLAQHDPVDEHPRTRRHGGVRGLVGDLDHVLAHQEAVVAALAQRGQGALVERLRGLERHQDPRALGLPRAGARRRSPPTRAAPPPRTRRRRCAPPARTAAGGGRGSRSRWPPSSAGCARASAGGWRSRGRCRPPRPPAASPSAPGTAGRRRRGSRRSAAGPRRRGCRRRGCSCRSRRRRSRRPAGGSGSSRRSPSGCGRGLHGGRCRRAWRTGNRSTPRGPGPARRPARRATGGRGEASRPAASARRRSRSRSATYVFGSWMQHLGPRHEREGLPDLGVPGRAAPAGLAFPEDLHQHLLLEPPARSRRGCRVKSSSVERSLRDST